MLGSILILIQLYDGQIPPSERLRYMKKDKLNVAGYVRPMQVQYDAMSNGIFAIRRGPVLSNTTFTAPPLMTNDWWVKGDDYYGDNECKYVNTLHESYFPACNNMHEINREMLIIINCGGDRCAFKYYSDHDLLEEILVFKTLR